MHEIYPSTMDAYTRNWTLAILALFAVVSAAPLSEGQQSAALLIALTIVMLCAAAYAVTIRAIVVTAETLVVERRAGRTVYPLNSIVAASVLAQGDLSGTLRLFANGGLFGWTGSFYHRDIGRFNMNAVRADRRIMLKFSDDRLLVLSADDPEGLVMAIERRRRTATPY